MNEPFSAFPRRIDPALEPPFTLGRLRAAPATLEISCEGAVESIEMRMMQVLIALHQRIGEAVSRDELSSLCWEGRIVGDDALNRAISRLRKVLSLDPAIAIDTIPKVGYRLRVEEAEQPMAAGKRPGRRWLLPASVAAALLGVAAWVGLENREARWSAEGMRPLTRDPGIEVYPALSPDGRQLAYAWAPNSAAATDIYLRGTALGETRPVRLTTTAGAEISPAWSSDGARLAFVRHSGNQPCEIVVMTPADRGERVAGRCRLAPLTNVDWLDALTLVYSDGPRDGPWRLYTLNVDSGQASPLTSAGNRMLGDSAPTVSHGGRQIAFRRTVTPGNDDIFLLDVATGAIRPLGVGGWNAIGIAWGPDDRTLFLTSNRGGDFGLWVVDTRRGGAPRRISYGIVRLGQLSSDRNGTVAIEAIRTRSNLFALSADGLTTALTTADSNDWEPDLARDGSIAFASDVSGSAELWVKRAGEDPVRLTQLAGSYVYSPRWSPDGRRIAFIGVDQGRNEVFTIDRDGSRLRKMTDDGINKGHLAWASTSELLYTAETAQGWRVMSLSLDGKARVVPGSEELIVLRKAPEGVLFGRGQGVSIMRLQYRNGRMARIPTRVSVPIPEAWMPSREGIYWLEGGDGGAMIRFTDWNGQSRPFSERRSLFGPGIAIRPSDNALVAPRRTEESADLVLFELTRN